MHIWCNKTQTQKLQSPNVYSCLNDMLTNSKMIQKALIHLAQFSMFCKHSNISYWTPRAPSVIAQKRVGSEQTTKRVHEMSRRTTDSKSAAKYFPPSPLPPPREVSYCLSRVSSWDYHCNTFLLLANAFFTFPSLDYICISFLCLLLHSGPTHVAQVGGFSAGEWDSLSLFRHSSSNTMQSLTATCWVFLFFTHLLQQ